MEILRVLPEPGTSSRRTPEDCRRDASTTFSTTITAADWSELFGGEDMEWEPDLNDYHTPVPKKGLPPVVEEGGAEAVEWEAKRQRVISDVHSASYVLEQVDAATAAHSAHYLREKARNHFFVNEAAFLSSGVNLKEFVFFVTRNDFSEQYYALAAQGSDGAKKKARKEIVLKDLPMETQKMFVGTGGSDAKEWSAWLDKEAVDVLDLSTSLALRREKSDLIVPTRWVRTNKHDGLVDKPVLAKSRLVVQGFRDKSLGQYRRDAPTASAIAENVSCSPRISRTPTSPGSWWAGRSTWTSRVDSQV